MSTHCRPSGRNAQRRVENFFPGERQGLYRVYVNMTHYGDMEYPHQDREPRERNVMLLYYANATWEHHHWGGETLFYEDHDTAVAVLPLPGSIALFRGSIEHTGGVPTRVCPASC